ncbi:MAG TPA: hypothetical protein VM307_09640 [Egibacteraceae bacterium]|nr:hypothetical protein [Egibacteraceae bacterium]
MRHLDILATHALRFADEAPVRAASAVTRLGERWLIAQDDATHAALWDHGPAEALRLFPPVQGADHFSSDAGTKHLKPDLEAAFTVDGRAVLLGSGSLPARMRGVVVDPNGSATVTDLTPLYHRVAAVLGVSIDALNLEGACVCGESVRWFQRGHAGGVASASVDVPLSALLAALAGTADVARAPVDAAMTYDLGEVDGVPLSITDAAALPDGRVVVSAAAEDAPNAVDDGPIVGSAIAVIDAGGVAGVAPLPPSSEGEAWKVEGLAVAGVGAHGVDVLAVVDQDDPERPSTALALTLR